VQFDFGVLARTALQVHTQGIVETYGTASPSLPFPGERIYHIFTGNPRRKIVPAAYPTDYLLKLGPGVRFSSWHQSLLVLLLHLSSLRHQLHQCESWTSVVVVVARLRWSVYGAFWRDNVTELPTPLPTGYRLYLAHHRRTTTPGRTHLQ